MPTIDKRFIHQMWIDMAKATIERIRMGNDEDEVVEIADALRRAYVKGCVQGQLDERHFNDQQNQKPGEY